MSNESYTLFSGGAQGAEAQFGKLAEYYGLGEVNYTFEGHRIERERGVRVLTTEELTKKDVSLTYVSKLLNRRFTNAEKMRKVLQTVMHQIESGDQIFVVGTIQEDGTVKGGTGWGAEFAKICNKDLFVFGQVKDGWFKWEKGQWVDVEAPVITSTHFTGTGTRFLEDNGKKALEELFARSFK
ncbi:conserved protein of unknown function [Pseudodesulfovibrio profundus]|uniref:Uncharacterized protein n=1 Tax=Pseudodesulfovibrio profundus TaxID=57320 RepID=A0A2C8FCX3_9BACT|nr:hypothetical protein [Pseudodesulfovibrio profundus]MBC15535.1 hypothetical protein [Desulfovibrio sp.]SOB59913.1 conserved protein of unknown function [Pseudodesulfovibrio profundus]|tara:strand:- start:563 stop:1111 length:549 start_codon:yes stop_codon:yes gene_type:complete